MRTVIVALIGSWLLVTAPAAAIDVSYWPCDAHELQQGAFAYNRLVCDGIRAYDQGQYRLAIEAFENALTKPIFEYPNFELLPRLALAYHFAGEADKAQETLSLAELTFSIFFGVLRCRESPDGSDWFVEDRSGNLVEHPFVERANNRMCGAILEPIYRPHSMGWVKHNCTLMGVLQEAQAQIGGN